MYRYIVVDENQRLGGEVAALLAEDSQFHCKGQFCQEKNVLSLLDQNDIDIVILAVNRRDIGEISLVKDICRNSMDTRLILVGEFGDYDTVRRAFLSGAFDYLLRPLSGEILRHSFERIHTDPHGAFLGKEAADLMDLLVEDIFLGGVRTEDLCAEMLKVIYQSVDFHHQKGAAAAKKVKLRLYEELVRRKPWLKKFLCPKDFEYYWGDSVKNPIEVLNQWNHDFSYAAGIVTKYQIVDKKLVYSIGRHVVTHVDEALTLDSVAHDLYLNKCYVSHIFKRETGLSFVTFLTEVKMDRAAVLLRDPQRKISEIASILGYNDGEYFSRCFKRLRGETPSDYRKRMKIHWQKPSLSMAFYDS